MMLNGEESLTKDEMLAEYDVQGFSLGLAVVRRRSDNRLGTLDYAAVANDEGNLVRYYYGFQEA